jgi:hypothetical protein
MLLLARLPVQLPAWLSFDLLTAVAMVLSGP